MNKSLIGVLLMLGLALMGAGCFDEPVESDSITISHYQNPDVTCYTFGGYAGGISCLKD